MIPELTLCGPPQDSLSEILTSHNTGLTGNYDGVICTWKILIQPFTRKIQLYFLDMTFQSTENCHQGFVKVV